MRKSRSSRSKKKPVAPVKVAPPDIVETRVTATSRDSITTVFLVRIRKVVE
jgi:hypothetical protein